MYQRSGRGSGMYLRAGKRGFKAKSDQANDYLDEEDFRELNFFAYEHDKEGGASISEVSDHDDWKVVRDELIKSVGIDGIPHIYVDRVENDGKLVLKHDHDGRDLELDHADKVIKHVKNIWKEDASLYTIIENEVWEI